jgi:hypothetical protein
MVASCNVYICPSGLNSLTDFPVIGFEHDGIDGQLTVGNSNFSFIWTYVMDTRQAAFNAVT